MVRSIDVRLEGPMDDGAWLDGALAVLREMADRMDRLPLGAALQIAHRAAAFDEARWAEAVRAAIHGRPTIVGVARHTHDGRARAAGFASGALTLVDCAMRLDLDDREATVLLSFHRGDDEAISDAEFRSWVEAIERVSGLRRVRDHVVDEMPPADTGRWFEELVAGAALRGAVTPASDGERSGSPPDRVGRIPIEGWGRLDLEMALTVTGGEALADRERSAVVDAVRAWVEHGTDVGFGGGTFHGWIPGEWVDRGYHVDVDTGSQAVDWNLAFADLGARLAALPSSAALGIVLGSPPD